MSQPREKTEDLQRLLDVGAKGVDQVYDELLECASARLYSLTRRMLRGYPRLRRWEQTDDVFQTAAIRLHRSLTEVRPESTAQFMALAATQVRRTLIDLVRHHFGPEGKHAKHQSDVAEPIPNNEMPGHLAQQASAAEEPETLENWLRFHESVESLAVEERCVFELIWYSNLTQQQVADLLDISPSTVKRRLRTVRIQLGALLEKRFSPSE